MKRLIALLLAVGILLCGCAGSGGETQPTDTTTQPTTQPTDVPTDPTTEPTTEPTEATTVPTEPPVVIRNPLSGQVLDAPIETRVFATTINNSRSALPFRGVSQADIFFEMLVNGYATRGLALFSDISQVSDVGSLRSARQNFIDIVLAYDAAFVHAGGAAHIQSAIAAAGIQNLDSTGGNTGNAFYRDQGRLDSGVAREHTQFGEGENIVALALKRNYRVTQDADKDYGLLFADDATPAGGEDATQIEMSFWAGNKTTTMRYDAFSGEYIYHQYGMDMQDENTGELIRFKNVFVILADVHNEGEYHIADLDGSGDGYFACGGKLIPIKWHHESENEPFTFTLTDGAPLQQGIGSSYMGIVPTGSPVSWE